MRKFIPTVIILLAVTFCVSLAQDKPRGITSKDYAVMISVSYETDPEPKIILNWEENELRSAFQISRKRVSDPGWTTVLATISDPATTSYEDNTVEIGVAYEYEVAAASVGCIKQDTLVPISFVAYGYTAAGIDVRMYDDKRTVLIVVDEDIYFDILGELATLEADLIAEGWGKKVITAPRAETFDKDAVLETKSKIVQAYNEEPTITTILLLGRVPVPYSGNFNPDAHGDHKGAWPADVYYGMIGNDFFWSDVSVNNGSASRAENRNTVGDGKFDPSQFAPGAINLQVGRVDFYNMPLFEKTELELLKQYLAKDHAWRTGKINYNEIGLVDDNFSAQTYIEGFGSSGWRNLGTFFGADNVSKKDWFTDLKTENHLWAYGCGGGSYTSCGGVGNTQNFVDNEVNAIFTMLFGSYFGDWDSPNNFLRAGLASSPTILTCAWAGRPHWYFHHMALGYPIGYSTLISQNNSQTYKPNTLVINQSPTIYAIGMNQVHMALMGDPTLINFPVDVPPVTNLQAVQPECSNVKISWTESIDKDVIGYRVYKSSENTGPWEFIGEQNSGYNDFVDTTDSEGNVYYFVRSVKRFETNSGSLLRFGRGEMINVNVIYYSTPSAFFIGLDSVCTGEEVVYSCQTASGVDYHWTVEIGGAIIGSDDQQQVTVNWDNWGNGILKLVVSDSKTGCSDSSTLSINVLPLPDPIIEGLDSSCVNEELMYSCSIETGVYYAWTVESAGEIIGPDDQQQVAVLWNSSGSGILKLVVTNSDTGCADSTNFTAAVLPLPTEPIIRISKDTLITDFAASYQWYFEGSLIPDAVFQKYFAGLNEGNYSVQITDENGCKSMSEDYYYIPLISRAQISVNSSTASPGEVINIPIVLADTIDFKQNGILGLKGKIKFNASLLFPIDEKGEVINGNRIIPFVINVDEIIGGQAVKNISVEAHLGNDTLTTIEIVDLEGIGGDIVFEVEPSVFMLTGICMEGGYPRLINTEGVVGLLLISPNPGKEEILLEYELIESGPTDIFICDNNGNEVMKLFTGIAQKGRFNKVFHTGKLSSGMYLVILQTPTGSFSKPLNIVK